MAKRKIKWSEKIPRIAGAYEVNAVGRFHAPFVNALVPLIGKGKALEVGPGSGAYAFYLLRFGIAGVDMVDNDTRIVEMLQTGIDGMGAEKVLSVRPGDVMDLPFPDKSYPVCYSQGLMEHFEGDDLFVAIAEQLRVAEHVFFSVPTQVFPNASIGYERRLRLHEWLELLREAGIKGATGMEFWSRMMVYVHIKASENTGRIAGNGAGEVLEEIADLVTDAVSKPILSWVAKESDESDGERNEVHGEPELDAEKLDAEPTEDEDDPDGGPA